MAIKRYTATKDNTITNAFKENLITRGTGSNMGASDILETFSIYGQSFSSSSLGGIAQTQELSRILIEFPIADIISDRAAGIIPASGSVDFCLKLYNAKHGDTVPKDMTLVVVPVSSSWEEGFGLDMEDYRDLTKDKQGSNWVRSAAGTAWATVGGTYLTSSVNNDYGDCRQTVSFSKGTEDLKLPINEIVERWIRGSLASGGYPNYGLGIHFTSSQEAYFSSSAGTFASGSVLQNVGGAKRSFYTKRFFSRTSEFFFKRPVIEARWDSAVKDNRGNVHYSSSLLSADDNLNTLYLYNFVKGELKNIPGLVNKASKIYVQMFSGSTAPDGAALKLVTSTDYTATAVPTVVTGGYSSTGIYSASFALTAAASPLTKIFDVWYLDGGNKLGTQVFTGSFDPITFQASTQNVPSSYVINIENLKPSYSDDETARFRVFTRLKNWNPTIYSKATAKVENSLIDNMYFKVNRVLDDYTVISYGTGSSSPEPLGTNTSYTRLAYDVSGSYFDLDMSMLEAGYMYSLQLAYYDNNSYKEFNQTFKFRVEEG
tara:strand:+ start:848 stop:2479 length:1632 start_codon:yes stop_codon:yes gene_type:complete